MLNNKSNQKVIPIYAKEQRVNTVNTRRITSIMNEITKQKSKHDLNNARFSILRQKVDQVIGDFNKTYRELVGTEITIMNLNIATEAITDRDNLVDNIYDTVMKEIDNQVCQ